LFDRAIAGWEVTVLVADLADSRPVRILGAEVLDLETVLSARGQGRRPDALGIASAICRRDSRANRGVLEALRDGGVEVVVWGEDWASPPEHPVDPVLHRLSMAAQAFKAQALCAAAAPSVEVGATETFRSGTTLVPQVATDLLPVG